MKTTIERIDDGDGVASRGVRRSGRQQRLPDKFPSRLFSPAAVLLAMVAAIILLDAALPLRDLWFHDALLTQMGAWPAWPTLLLFPGWAIVPHLPNLHGTATLVVSNGWASFFMLMVAFVLVFLVYLLALRRLPGSISWRFILLSTLLIGCLYMLIPVVTSPDLFSYIAYARMGVLHGLNPLTTIPTAIHSDPVYRYVFWVDQPSAYGPTWAIITYLLQGVFAIFGNTYVMPMVIALRVLGLMMHLISTWLVWSISGQLQQINGQPAHPTRKRLAATLAFAWNPLLLLEACVNAHNDAVLLVFVLLVIWVLAKDKIRKMHHDEKHDLRAPLAAACLLALGTCMKINAALLFPGLLCYAWMQAPANRRIKHVGMTVASYVAVIVLLYAPFWQGGAIFNVFQVNPATYRSINSLADFLALSYNSIAALFGFPVGAPIGSPAERFMHTFSMGIFVLLYLVMLWRMLRAPWHLRSLRGLIYWLAVTWLLYCAIGSPWFWPWYLVTFLGLFALLEASDEDMSPESQGTLFPWRFWLMRTPWTARLLTFSMLSLYCLTTGPTHSFVRGLPGLQWSNFTGAWGWILPLAGGALLTINLFARYARFASCWRISLRRRLMRWR